MVTPGSGGRRRRRTRKGTSPTSYLDPLPPEPRQSAHRAPGRSAPASDRGRVDGAEAAAPHLGPPRSPRQAAHDHRGRGRPRARRIRLGDHPNRVNPRHHTNDIPSAGSVAARHARGTRDSPMSNPPPGWPRSFLDSGSPRRTMVLRHTQTRAYQSDRASRTASRTATHPADHNPALPTQMREINDPHLTTRSPYQGLAAGKVSIVALAAGRLMW